MAQNLKCVVQHHSVGLINVFKQDLVGFANELWGNGAITEAVKDGILDSSKGGVDLRASNLVSSICKSLSVLQNLSGQSVHHMTCLLHVLEKAGESILANNMRIELASMGVDLPPYYSATSISETSDKREEKTSQLHVIEDGISKSQRREDQLESALQRIKELQDDNDLIKKSSDNKDRELENLKATMTSRVQVLEDKISLITSGSSDSTIQHKQEKVERPKGNPTEEPGIQESKLQVTDFPHVISAISSVVDWFTLGIFLEVNYEQLKTIESNYHGNLNRCRQEMLNIWIRSGNATWSTLVNVLYSDDVKEKAVAEEIEKKYLTVKKQL